MAKLLGRVSFQGRERWIIGPRHVVCVSRIRAFGLSLVGAYHSGRVDGNPAYFSVAILLLSSSKYQVIL